jgi:transcriptional regulator with XRE-family HTH domain
MFEFQKNIIEKFLKEKGKTKRELAKFLNIKENSINRTLKNPGIALSKLMKIANFVDVDIIELFPKKNTIQESKGEDYQFINYSDTTNQLTISNLSEALNQSCKTIENLVRIISDNYSKKD